jgi:hypothetical protein
MYFYNRQAARKNAPGGQPIDIVVPFSAIDIQQKLFSGDWNATKILVKIVC